MMYLKIFVQLFAKLLALSPLAGKILLLLALAGTSLWWYYGRTPSSVSEEIVSATVAPEVSKIQKEEIRPPVLRVYKPAAKEKLSLPIEVKNNPAERVLSASVVPNTLYSHTVIGTVNENTGEVQTFVRTNPLPLFLLQHHGYVRLGYGYRPGYGMGYKASISEDLVQIKALHFGVDATLHVDASMDRYAGVFVEYRW